MSVWEFVLHSSLFAHWWLCPVDHVWRFVSSVFRPQTQSQCLASVQTSSLAYHLSRFPSFNDQHLTKDVFYTHHHPSSHHSSNSTNCSLTPYASTVRPTSSYSSGTDPVQTEQGLDAQTAAQILDSAEGFGFVGAGLNPSSGGCQGQTYSAAGHSGKEVFWLFMWKLWVHLYKTALQLQTCFKPSELYFSVLLRISKIYEICLFALQGNKGK